MVAATLKFGGILTPSDPQKNSVLIIGQPRYLSKIKYSDVKVKLEPRVDEETFKKALDSNSEICALWLNNATLAQLPVKCSRHNTPSRAHALTKMVKSCLRGGDEFVVIVCEKKDVVATGCAVARALPLYQGKSASISPQNVTVQFLLANEDSQTPLSQSELDCLTAQAHGIRLSAKIVDIPCNIMHTNTFLEEINEVGKELGIKPMVISGELLDERGFGGIYNVGKAAVNAPALAVLSHKPTTATKTIAWVGKGIVFDTGGLCIKTKTGMCGMKRDCGGAAGILGAFYAAVKLGFKENLHAVFCLAENAVGPTAFRPDDVFTMYSGLTVEINNTDAEGRLVLGDGVAYARKDLKADIIVDMATLTGAQGIATGKYHASILTNNEDLELACISAGRISGDLVHPVPYSPELHYSEFTSSVADMKNSVADRGNAQVSCAGLFIGSHLGFTYPGMWLHIDMAAPVHNGERATGYGVALLTTLFGSQSQNPLLQFIAPSIAIQEVMDVDCEESDSKKQKS
ncbi:probable aminopeptidase NPEPL1 [Mytilus californianus]|uniref:probable aminopeptidase NPEPL1 n=1 Tax=Mytilus californianus TaxID=6549 RepID=UPI002246770A|nr:probable aminopeptidase NPEPL1 [Mytilus californianus]XP_052059691.1 probable aminopeptidase NPEPL1 [Mytilus californianus]